MAEKKEPTEKYVVIKKHCLNHKVGAVIDLTAAKAQSLSGKIRIQSEEIDEDEFAASIGAIQDENDVLVAANKKLEAEVKKLKAQIVTLKKPAK